MPFDLTMPAYAAAFAIAGIALLSRFGWPQLRLRTHSELHGGLRVIEIALSLSPGGAAHRRSILNFFLAIGRATQRSFQACFQRLALSAANPAAVPNHVATNRHERLSTIAAQPQAQPSPPAVIDRGGW